MEVRLEIHHGLVDRRLDLLLKEPEMVVDHDQVLQSLSKEVVVDHVPVLQSLSTEMVVDHVLVLRSLLTEMVVGSRLCSAAAGWLRRRCLLTLQPSVIW